MSNVIQRKAKVKEVRDWATEFGYIRNTVEQSSNGDESSFASENYFASYSKGLPHHSSGSNAGEVNAAAFEALVAATQSGRNEDYERIPLGLPSNNRKLTNPQAGWNFDLQGGDPQQFLMPPAPKFSSAESAAEMVELYWMALARDVCFNDYATNPIIAKGIADLNNMSDYHGTGPANGSVNAGNIFRGFTEGDLKGPFISQFLLMDIPYGTLCISQRQKTAVPNRDYMTAYSHWLDVQNGRDTTLPFDPCKTLASDAGFFSPARSYIKNLRDLATYVHYDALYEGYLNACLILLGMGAPLDKGNPYKNSATQSGFGTFGGPHILSLVTEVATRALKAVWHQKWNVHRRLRPEAFGGRIHQYKTGGKKYPIHADLLNADALTETFTKFSSYLLPQAFAEGSPTHPAYGAGHATVAGACVTILKAWFDESYVIPDPVIPKCDGTGLITDPSGELLTVGGELNKVAANVSIGRNAGGVHYWTDYANSLRLGEEIAISLLREQKMTYHEVGHFTLHKFDCNTITI